MHGVGGIIGTLLTDVFAYGPLSATMDHAEGVYIGGAALLKVQVWVVLATVIRGAIASFILLEIVDLVIGLRVGAEAEMEGLDVVLHGERLG